MTTATGRRHPSRWFEVEHVDAGIWAIHEPRYWQRTVCHLVAGRDRAVLIDTGSGLSDLRAVVDELTALPVSAIATHVQWDHIGAHHAFDRVMAPDLPSLRSMTAGTSFRSTPRRSLVLRPRRFVIDEWVRPGGMIDLGGRHLRLHHTPGHTPESLSLDDPDRGHLFPGDLVYDGPLVFGLTPGSDLQAARRSISTPRN